jgi:IclR family pca regulon transcriptional regulator
MVQTTAYVFAALGPWLLGALRDGLDSWDPVLGLLLVVSVAISVGTRFPAYATSMGQVLLAHLSASELEDYFASARLERLTDRTLVSRVRLRERLVRVREQGYALADQELEEGLRSIAVPVRDVDGQVVAAVNVSSHASRMSREDAVAELLPLLRETASAIEADRAAVSGLCPRQHLRQQRHVP